LDLLDATIKKRCKSNCIGYGQFLLYAF